MFREMFEVRSCGVAEVIQGKEHSEYPQTLVAVMGE